MSTECELKLDLGPAADAKDLATLLDLGPATVTKMRATYFDTPDFVLAKHDCSLRIRQEGRRRVQTVKTAAAPASGMLTRNEWEQPARGKTPQLAEDNPVVALLGERIGELEPQFDVAVERRVWQVETGKAVIEIALDRGEARAGDRAEPFAEIELEVKGGDVEEMFLLGRRIGRLTPARLGIVTKAERARRLLRDPGKADKARAVALTASMSSADAFRQIAHGCIAHYRLNETKLLTGDDVDSVHQARVAIRRLRSALTVFRPMVAGRKARRFNDELRWLAGQLGAVRDIDVLIERVPAGAFRIRLAAARAEAFAELRRAVESDLTRELMIDMAEWLSVGKWSRAKDRRKDRKVMVCDRAERAIGKLHRKLLKQGETISGPDDEQRHEARKTGKKLRYTAEFFGKLYDKGAARKGRIRYLAVLEELQDRLGALNDIAAMPDTARKLGLSVEGVPELSGETGRRGELLSHAGEAMTLVRQADGFWR